MIANDLRDTGGFSRLSTRGARLTLALVVLTAVFLVGVTFSSLKSGFADAPSRGASDIALYAAQIQRVHGGEAYYEAAGAELRGRGYPTRSIFNWRTPLLVAALARLPQDLTAAKAVLGVAALALIFLALGVTHLEGSLGQSLLCGVLLVGALLPAVLGDLLLMHEVWAGALIALSAVAYAENRWRLGLGSALAALFVRELAAPYCLFCFGWALWRRQWREIAGWVLGFAAYAIYYGLHAAQVVSQIGPEDIAHTQGWIRFGGAGFVISTVQMNVFLLLLPQWVTALYMAAAMLGFAGWSTPAGQRIGLPAMIYLLAFSIAGQDFNQYWGSLTAPLMCLGAARAPVALVQLWRAARASATVVTPCHLLPEQQSA